MQEIIPSLEDVWMQSSSEEHSVCCFIVEDFKLKELLPHLINADNIVITCFTVRLAELGHLLRTQFSIEARFIIHLHNMATIGCWPLHQWNLGKALLTTDIFISTCSRDFYAMNHCFTNHRTEIIPFSLLDLGENESSNSEVAKDSKIPLYYVGRISAQKNLHTLIFSLFLLKKKLKTLPAQLTFFGGEDNLGSPNMEEYRAGYKEHLIKLVGELGLNDDIKFAGFVQREQLYRKHLNKKHILVSPSLHSDENFGIAALRGLSMGNDAVLSDWGGHTDHAEYFPEQVSLVPVLKSDRGPIIDPFTMASTLNQAFNNFTTTALPKLPERYTEQSISNKLCSLALQKQNSEGLPLQVTSVASELYIARNHFYDQFKALNPSFKGDSFQRGCKIFDSYFDQSARAFFSAYGMTGETLTDAGSALFLVPWANNTEDSINIDDFHRGELKLDLNAGDIPLIISNGKKIYISHSCSQMLLNLGYAFSIG